MRFEELLEKDDFSVWFPDAVTLTKADGTGQRRIGGFASTQDRDRQGEVLIQKGLDFSEFVEHGYFNDNHKQDTDAVVGVPELAKFMPGKGWYVEGYLLPNWPLADRIWGLAKALIGTKRKLGFSVEGKVKERGPDNKILRAIIRNVAITNRPVNTSCGFETLSKAFATAEEIEECYDGQGKACSCQSPQAVTRKGLSAGYGSPATGGGASLIANQSDDDSESEDDIENEDPKQILRRRKLNLQKGMEFLRKVRPGLADTTYARIYLFAMRRS